MFLKPRTVFQGLPSVRRSGIRQLGCCEVCDPAAHKNHHCLHCGGSHGIQNLHIQKTKQKNSLKNKQKNLHGLPSYWHLPLL